MSSNVTHAKEPLFRMVKRDAIPQKKAWMIRAAAFLLSLATGAVVIMMLGHNPFSVYISMIKGAWGTKTVSYETIKIAIPLLITAIGISFAFKMKFWNIGAEGQILVGAVAAGAFGLFTAFSEDPTCNSYDAGGDRSGRFVRFAPGCLQGEVGNK